MTDAAASETREAEPEHPAAADLREAAVLDCRGLSCPLPILKTRKAIAPLASGEVLKVVATDPGSVPDMAAFSRATGHAVVRRTEEAGLFSFWLRKA